MIPFAELAVTTNFSFLRGGSHPEELVATAARLGLAGLAVADLNTLAGVVRGHVAAKEAGFRYAVGCRLAFRDGTPDILVWPTDRAAYGRLCRLLTLGNRRAPKGACHLDLADLLEWGEGLILGVVPGEQLRSSQAQPPASPVRRRGAAPFPGCGIDGNADPLPSSPFQGEGSLGSGNRSFPARSISSATWSDKDENGQDRPPRVPPPERGRTGGGQSPGNELPATLAALVDAFPGNVRLMVSRLYGPADHRRLAALDRIARHYGVPLLATNDVLYHTPARRPLQDVITAIREHKTLAAAGRLLAQNAERHLKDAAEMARLFRDYPEAVAESRAVLERLQFSLDELRYQYPDEPTGDAATPQEALERLTEEGARFRYPDGVPARVRAQLDHELALIGQLDYAPYFLTVHDIVRYARGKGILAQGRGSAANSAVCFVLGITEVDPERSDLLFERFISPERNEPPDIDVDFEHERREEVMQYIYEKYGRHRAGLAATVITYRTRSAVREVGKAFGLSDDTIGALSGTIWGWSSAGVREADVRRVGLDPADRTMRQVMALSQELIGFPRHLSQHVGGFVMTRDRLDEMVPVMNAAMEDRTTVEWDKDDLDALRMLKVDVLALGMLSCIRRAFAFLDRHYGEALTLATIPSEDPAVYRMLQRADSLGVFQVESRAQMTMLPRLKPANFYDLVIEVAIVRPGPIQGDMVHPYLRRRQGLEKVVYPSPAPEHGAADELEQVLGRTLGVPLFQEQAMKIAIVAAGFTPGEADRLRRAMATFKRVGTIKTFQDKMVEGMVARGYDRDFAERCFRQIEGFGEYGFPESHAASFALLVYASAWLKCHYPDVFCAALLNSQPMGFYAPAQIVRDAIRHGVAVHPPDINLSDWDAGLEGESDNASFEARPLRDRAPQDEEVSYPPDTGGAETTRPLPHPEVLGRSPSLEGRSEQGPPSQPFRRKECAAAASEQNQSASTALPAAERMKKETSHSHTVPPPERGRACPGPDPGTGGGQTGRAQQSRFDRTPAKTKRARSLRRDATSAERLLWSKLKSAQLEGASFRRQHPMGPYVLDFYSPSLGIVVELDGDSHSRPGRCEADRRRDLWLARRGLTVLRFWNSEVRENLSGVVEQIRLAVLAAQPKTPSRPPPFRGRGQAVAASEQNQPSNLSSSGAERESKNASHPHTVPPPERGIACPEPNPGTGGGRSFSAPQPNESAQPAPPPDHQEADHPHTIPPPERGRSGGGRDLPTPRTNEAERPAHPRGTQPASSITLRTVPLSRSTGKENPRLHPTNADMAGDIRSTHAVRLGFRQIKGFREEDARALVAARGAGYDSVRDLWLRSGLSRAAIERLADADAFRSLGLDRRDALWAARGLGGPASADRPGSRLPLFDHAALGDIRREPDVALPPMPVGEHVVNDYRYLSLSLKAHPVSFLRQQLTARRILANERLRDIASNRRITVAGLVLVRQRPGTASGVIFMTIEDETDIANVIVWPKVFERFRPVVLGARLVAVTGKVQSESGVIHVVSGTLEDLTPMLETLAAEAGVPDGRDPRSGRGQAIESLARADEVRRPSADMREKIGLRHPRTVRFFTEEPALAADLASLSPGKVMPKGRNFH